MLRIKNIEWIESRLTFSTNISHLWIVMENPVSVKEWTLCKSMNFLTVGARLKPPFSEMKKNNEISSPIQLQYLQTRSLFSGTMKTKKNILLKWALFTFIIIMASQYLFDFYFYNYRFHIVIHSLLLYMCCISNL